MFMHYFWINIYLTQLPTTTPQTPTPPPTNDYRQWCLWANDSDSLSQATVWGFGMTSLPYSRTRGYFKSYSIKLNFIVILESIGNDSWQVKIDDTVTCIIQNKIACKCKKILARSNMQLENSSNILKIKSMQTRNKNYSLLYICNLTLEIFPAEWLICCISSFKILRLHLFK